jgi:hypothetical protein
MFICLVEKVVLFLLFVYTFAPDKCLSDGCLKSEKMVMFNIKKMMKEESTVM